MSDSSEGKVDRLSDRTPDCTAACEVMPECARCGHRKKPRGRSAPMQAVYCDRDCPGYLEEPLSGHLWPGEGRGDD